MESICGWCRLVRLFFSVQSCVEVDSVGYRVTMTAGFIDGPLQGLPGKTGGVCQVQERKGSSIHYVCTGFSIMMSGRGYLLCICGLERRFCGINLLKFTSKRARNRWNCFVELGAIWIIRWKLLIPLKMWIYWRFIEFPLNLLHFCGPDKLPLYKTIHRTIHQITD